MKIGLTKNNDSYTSVKHSLGQIEPELRQKLQEITEVVIKINFVSADIELATTPITAVKAFIDHVREYYKGDIIIAEEASGGSTKDGFKRYGYKDLADSDDRINLLDLHDDSAVTKKIDYPGGALELPFSRTIIEAPFLVSICRAKTHNDVIVTLSLKNVFVGAIKGGFRTRSNIHQGDQTHDILKEIAKIVMPKLSIIDGTIGMQGNGPTSGHPIRSNWSIASLEPLAADTLATELMGLDHNSIDYFSMIHNELGIRTYDNVDMQIVGNRIEDCRMNYELHTRFK